jgi:hypothetical protein
MPVAVYNYLFALRYNRAPDEVAGIVVFSTLLSFLVLPPLLLFILAAIEDAFRRCGDAAGIGNLKMNHKNRVRRCLPSAHRQNPRGNCASTIPWWPFLGIDAVNFSSRLEFIDRLDLDHLSSHPLWRWRVNHRIPTPVTCHGRWDSGKKRTGLSSCCWMAVFMGRDLGLKFLVTMLRRSPGDGTLPGHGTIEWRLTRRPRIWAPAAW